MMSECDDEEYEELPIAEGLLDGPINYDLLKREIQEKGPLRQTNTDSGVMFFLNITPCACGFEGCAEDAILVIVQHGVISFRSSVEKETLLSHQSLKDFFHSFFHYPEAYYSSSADEQAVEGEVYTKLGIFPFAVYAAADVEDELAKQFASLDEVEVDFWQAHNLLPLLRILAIKRKFRNWANEEVESVSGEDCKQLVEDVFDIGFLAGRLWSEYRTKENLEAVVERGEASIAAQRRRTKASGKKSADTRKENLECFLTEIERLQGHYPAFSEEVIVKQAYANASQKRSMPTSEKTRHDYETELRSKEPFKSRYEAVFRENA